MGVFTPVSGSISPSPPPSDGFLHLKTAKTTTAITHKPPAAAPTDIPIVSPELSSAGGGAAPDTSSAVLAGASGLTGPSMIGSSGSLGFGFGFGTGFGYGFGSGLLASSILFYSKSSEQDGVTVSKRKEVKSVGELFQSSHVRHEGACRSTVNWYVLYVSEGHGGHQFSSPYVC